jgi:hypothetical protein
VNRHSQRRRATWIYDEYPVEADDAIYPLHFFSQRSFFYLASVVSLPCAAPILLGKGKQYLKMRSIPTAAPGYVWQTY